MELSLKKPIVFFDLETTGTNIAKDRIVEMSALKVLPNGEEEIKTWVVNPTIPIPKESSDIHGITDDMVADKPVFKQLAKEIFKFIQDADLAGYNSNRFDVPLLAEELLRTEIELDVQNRKLVDVQTIFFKQEPRTLTAAYKFYCDKVLEGAHGAEADTLATYEVLKSQLDKYDNLQNDMEFLSKFSSHNKRNVDFAGLIVYNGKGEECFNFGKHKGKKVIDVFASDGGYYGWLQGADFPLYTKKVFTRLKLSTASF